jgi:hypothetical protein
MRPSSPALCLQYTRGAGGVRGLVETGRRPGNTGTIAISDGEHADLI